MRLMFPATTRLALPVIKRLAWAVFGLCVAFYIASIAVFLIERGRPELAANTSASGLVYSVITFSFPLGGILITHRQPRNRIGWLMLGVGLIALFPGDSYAEYGLLINPGSLPGADIVAALTAATWAPALGIVGTFLILLFPTGRVPSRRWRFVGWMSGAAIAYVYLLITLMSRRLQTNPALKLRNPLSIHVLGEVQNVLLPTIVVLPLSILMCAVALVQRFRGSEGVERQQLKWLASAGAVVASLYLVAMVGSLLKGNNYAPDPPWLVLIQNVAVQSFLLIPIAIAVAILKHGLYEIDVVINKTLVFGALASFITAVYVGIVVGVGSLAGRGGEPNLALSIAATAIVAVAFQPVRERVQRFANRLVYGTRATPYEVLSNFADRVGGSYDAAELLPRMARTVAQGVGASRVEVWLAIGSGLVREATWPQPTSPTQPPGPVTATGIGDLDGDRVVPVRHQGELLGGLTVTKPAGEALTPAEDRLLDDVAAQAGLVLRNVKLIEELRNSRQRLVTTSDEERRRLERNLHDGAQQSLVSVALMIRTVRARLGGDDAVGAALDSASEQLRMAIEELRELARGIHPAILTDRGLGPAIQSLADRSPVPVIVDYQLTQRPPEPIEITCYFMVAEALTNTAKYASATSATITVTHTDTHLILRISDDGVGGADTTHGSGLRGLTDRIAVINGTLDLTSPPGHGTTLTATIPLQQTSPQPLPRDGSSNEIRTATPLGAAP